MDGLIRKVTALGGLIRQVTVLGSFTRLVLFFIFLLYCTYNIVIAQGRGHLLEYRKRLR